MRAARRDGERQLLVDARGRARAGRARRSSSTAGPQYGPEGGPDVDEERFCEIWNLVFMQDEVRRATATSSASCRARTSTPGSALERVAMVLQDVDNVFETDLLAPAARRGRSRLSGTVVRRGRAHDVAIRIVGRARPGDDVPDRPTASSPRTRAAATSCAGCSAAWSRTRGGSGRAAGHAGRSSSGRSSMASVTPTPSSVRTGLHRARWPCSEEERFSATLRQGMMLFESRDREGDATGRGSPGDDGVPAARHVRLPASSSRSSCGRGAGCTVDDGCGSRTLMEEQRRPGAGRRPRRCDVGLDAGDVAADGPTEFVGYEQPRGGRAGSRCS